MKKGKTLIELAAEIQRRAESKRDIVASSKALVVVPAPQDVRLQIGSKEEIGINNVAHRQLQGHLKIPAEYYDRMRAEAPELLARNVNEWLHRADEKRLVRILDGKARAFLSDRYRPLENEDLAEAVLPVLQSLELDIISAEVTETRFYLKAVDKAVSRELAKVGAAFGDGGHAIVRIASPAITIANSEVGFSALSVLVGIYDGFCSNLATFAERSARKYHVGARHDIGEEVYAMLSDNARKLTDAALWAQIRDVTKAAFDRTRFEELCDRVEETKKDKIESNDIVETVSFASKKLGLTEAEGKSVLKHLIEGADLSRFGFYNAITRTAEDLEDYDRASDFERLGGKIIELPRNQWEEIAKAA